MNFYKVLDSVAAMEVDELEKLLDFNLIYGGIRADIFLEKLAEVFSMFNHCGDQFLETQPVECCSMSCTNGVKQLAYKFIGKKSNAATYLRFLVVPEIGSAQYDIKDISTCFSYNCDRSKSAIQACFLLDLYEDDYQDYGLSLEIEIYKRAAKKAQRQFDSLASEIEQAWWMKWIQENQATYSFLNAHYDSEIFSWSKFLRTFRRIRKDMRMIENLTQPNFLSLVNQRDELPDEQLTHLILYVERILSQFKPYESLIFDWEDDRKICHFKGKNAFLAGEIFSSFVYVRDWFKHHQKALLGDLDRCKGYDFSQSDFRFFDRYEGNWSGTLTGKLEERERTRHYGKF